MKLLNQEWTIYLMISINKAKVLNVIQKLRDIGVLADAKT